MFLSGGGIFVTKRVLFIVFLPLLPTYKLVCQEQLLVKYNFENLQGVTALKKLFRTVF